jgi:hypothetical protein
MGSLTASRPAESYEIAAIQALQECSALARRQGMTDTLHPILAMSVLCENRALRGEAIRARVIEIADATDTGELAAEFLNRAAGGFARCSDVQSAAELMEAAALRRLKT